MHTYVQGLLFGLLLQIAIGPVCLGVFQRAVVERLRGALGMVLGVAIVDALYIGLAILGVSGLMQVDAIRTAVGLAGAGTLAYFGLQNLRGAAVAPDRQGQKGNWLSSLRYGLVLTMTNPLTILFWGGVFAALISGDWLAAPGAVYLFAAGCVSATLVFLSGVAVLGRSLSRLLRNPRALVWLNRAVGLLLLGFAVKLALDVVG